MNDLALAFVTGLTTGGLSCMAVQGGLLATSIAKQIEQEIGDRRVPATAATVAAGTVTAGTVAAGTTPRKVKRVSARSDATPARQSSVAVPAQRQRLSLPILLFLSTKLLAYTLLGFLLGSAGSLFQLSLGARAILQIAIGIFMIGNALRMLDVHPIFRYFNMEPPKAVTRYIRRTAKQNSDVVTPAFLGLLTVFIPCGVTQAMMAVALGTGSGYQGAAIMFSFVLGTSPVFFALAYLATRLGGVLEKRFALVAAAVLLIFGFVSMRSGFALTGFDLSFPARASALTGPPAALSTAPVAARPAVAPTATTAAPAVAESAAQVLQINAGNSGYTPALLRAKAGQPLRLDLVTNKTTSCSRAFVIPALNMQRVLPETGKVSLDIPAQKAGTAIKFTCSMGMYTGAIQFVD